MTRHRSDEPNPERWVRPIAVAAAVFGFAGLIGGVASAGSDLAPDVRVETVDELPRRAVGVVTVVAAPTTTSATPTPSAAPQAPETSQGVTGTPETTPQAVLETLRPVYGPSQTKPQPVPNPGTAPETATPTTTAPTTTAPTTEHAHRWWWTWTRSTPTSPAPTEEPAEEETPVPTETPQPTDVLEEIPPDGGEEE